MKDVFNSTKNIASIFQRCTLFIYTILLFFSLFTYITPESTLSILEHFHFLDHPFFISGSIPMNPFAFQSLSFT